MELTKSNFIQLDVDANNKDELLDLIIGLLSEDKRICDTVQLKSDIYDREEIVPTSIGDLIAIPHALSNAVCTASLVYVRLKNEIDWNAEDKAKYIFCITVPKENKNNEHLKILSMIARNMLDDEFRDVLFNSQSQDEVYQRIIQVAEAKES